MGYASRKLCPKLNRKNAPSDTPASPRRSRRDSDKFQGQEAPIAIYSTATSSGADAPRGMEFLYSLNRLNVATSRAKCVCIMVGSPALFEVECRTPRQAQLANAFCRFSRVGAPGLAPVSKSGAF
jgi:hypothetical protein